MVTVSLKYIYLCAVALDDAECARVENLELVLFGCNYFNLTEANVAVCFHLDAALGTETECAFTTTGATKNEAVKTVARNSRCVADENTETHEFTNQAVCDCATRTELASVKKLYDARVNHKVLLVSRSNDKAVRNVVKVFDNTNCTGDVTEVEGVS